MNSNYLAKCIDGQTPEYRELVLIVSKNNAKGEIISKNEDDSDTTSTYTVQIRGDPQRNTFNVEKRNLKFCCPDDAGYGEEQIRKKLFECHSSCKQSAEKSGTYQNVQRELTLRNHIIGHLLGDECGYLIEKHTNAKNLKGLPKRIEEKVLTLLIEQFYTLDGLIICSGRHLTSYCRALVPFVVIEEVYDEVRKIKMGKITTGPPPTGAETIAWFESLVLAKNPSQSASLFFRAFAYGQWRVDNASDDDSLLDAFYVVFSAIQMITGKGSSERMRFYQNEIQASIDAEFFQRYGTKLFGPPGVEKTSMNWRHLHWSLCKLFLNLGITVRDKIPENQYHLLLPNPYGDTITEQLIIANDVIERRDHPASYLASYTMMTDVKDLVAKDCVNKLLSNALRVAKLGKEAAFKISSPYFSYQFLLIESFWIPTSLWPRTDVVTYKCILKRLEQAKAFKEQCQDYKREWDFHLGKLYHLDLMAFLKSTARSNSISLSDEISSIQLDPWIYCSARFANTSYYKPGGKYERLTKITCSYCSKQLSSILCCARCKKENYCGRKCQKKHWKIHKKVCAPVEK
mmetsp:Transcript_16927/g.22372  ORF Transcript_16927/g.22372 Transcript_16927/m.22372 type:complete len:572 (-) Transcript_16927:130-1845(-)